jgi:uncharacterized protein YxeA
LVNFFKIFGEGRMKKVLIIITIVLVIVGALFATPLLGRTEKSDSVFYGTAYADEGGGGI